MLNKIMMVGIVEQLGSSNQEKVEFNISQKIKIKDKTQVNRFKVFCFGKVAEYCSSNLKRGGQVWIEGSLRYKVEEIKDFTKINAEIRATKVKVLDEEGEVYE